MNPRVDVLIPCHNYARFLEVCAASALNQEGVDVRVLIIDDASTDDSEAVGRAIAARDSRVEFRRHQTNKGHIATYNEGIEWLTAEYWALLSADDLLAPGALARAAAVMDRHPNVGMTYGRALKCSSEDVAELPVSEDDDTYLVVDGSTFIRYMCEITRNPVPTPSAIVRTSTQKAVGGYRADLPHSGDVEMWLRLAAHADVGALKACQAVYRWHGNNMQLGYLRPILDDIPEYWHAFDDLFTRFGHRVRDGHTLHRLVARKFAETAFTRGSKAFDAGDMASFETCMAFVSSVCPEMMATESWRRVTYKATLGPKTWRVLKPIMDGIRGIKEDEIKPTDHSLPVRVVIGEFPRIGPKVEVCQYD